MAYPLNNLKENITGEAGCCWEGLCASRSIRNCSGTSPSRRMGTICKDGVAVHPKSQTGLFCGEPCAQLNGSFWGNLEMGVKY